MLLLYFAARILRAVRIGARLGFSFTHQTGRSITYLASSVLRLDKVYQNLFFLLYS